MSMASPTLRSSSTMVPLPSFSSWLTSIADLPSTAETVTGTSNTASRSWAICLGAASACASLFSRAGAAPAFSPERSGRSTLSVAMDLSFQVVVRKTVGNQPAQRFFDDRLAAFGAAAAPFDAAVGAPHGGIGGQQHPAVIALFMGDGIHARGECLNHVGGGAQGDARLDDRLVHGLAQRHLDIVDGKR